MFEQLKSYLKNSGGKMPPRFIDNQKFALGQWCDTQLDNYRKLHFVSCEGQVAAVWQVFKIWINLWHLTPNFSMQCNVMGTSYQQESINWPWLPGPHNAVSCVSRCWTDRKQVTPKQECVLFAYVWGDRGSQKLVFLRWSTTATRWGQRMTTSISCIRNSGHKSFFVNEIIN